MSGETRGELSVAAERIFDLIFEAFPHLSARADCSRGALTLSDAAMVELHRRAFSLVVGGLTVDAASAELARMSVELTSEDKWVRAGDVLQRLRDAAGLGVPPPPPAAARPDTDPTHDRWLAIPYEERRAAVDRALSAARARGDKGAVRLISEIVDRDPELEGCALAGLVPATLAKLDIIDVGDADGAPDGGRAA